MELTVTTFNLRTNAADDRNNAWELRYPAAAKAILASGSAIVCTQEGMYEMLQQLQPLLPFYQWIGEGRQGGREDEHCAVFYRSDKLEAAEWGHFGLSEFPDRLGYRSWNTDYPRMCTWVRFKAANDREWFVYNTHLDHISEEAQVCGIRLITEHMKEARSRTGLPAILTGDFNTYPSAEVIRILEQADMHNAYSAHPGGAEHVGRTWHGFEGGAAGQPIDYIFTTPDIRALAVAVDRDSYLGRFPSDHYPVNARLSIDEPEAEWRGNA